MSGVHFEAEAAVGRRRKSRKVEAAAGCEKEADDRRQVPLHGMFCDFNADWQTGGIMLEETAGQDREGKGEREGRRVGRTER